MTKRQVAKKEPTIKQKQKQQQNVVVNIGTIAKKRKPRQTKPKQPPKQDAKQAQIQQGIITRGPNTYFQQPQPAQPQPNINELFRLIQQQQKVSVPEPPAVGGTFLNPVQATSSIVPEPVAEPKRENELEKIRKARTEKFAKQPIELKQPALIRVIEEENAGLGLEDKAYQGFKEGPSKMKALFDQATQNELQLSIFGEADPGASINLYPAERIAPETVKPNIDLPVSGLLSPPATKGLNFRSALRGLVSEARTNKDFF